MRVLIGFGSTHGSTAKIAERIAVRMREHGTEVALTGDVRTVSPVGFDAILLGGRVHGDRYPWRITRFIRRNVQALNSRPSAFFSVSLLQLADDPLKRFQTATLPARTLAKLGWTADRVEVFAGTLAWTKFGIFRPLMKAIWKRSMKDAIDPSGGDQEFTDWKQVDRFADSFLRFAGLCVEPAQEFERVRGSIEASANAASTAATTTSANAP